MIQRRKAKYMRTARVVRDVATYTSNWDGEGTEQSWGRENLLCGSLLGTTWRGALCWGWKVMSGCVCTSNYSCEMLTLAWGLGKEDRDNPGNAKHFL